MSAEQILQAVKSAALAENQVLPLSPPMAEPRVVVIYKPNVNMAQVDYPMLKFSAGDKIRIDSGGCVRTGIGFQTWKRYVDPVEADLKPSNSTYGMISIPGVIQLQPIRNVNGKTITIPNISGQTPFLRLGYSDSNYKDNGYGPRITALGTPDHGLAFQCEGRPDAYVAVTIWKGTATAGAAAQQGPPKNMGQVVIRSHNGNFVSTGTGGTRQLTADRTQFGPSEIFELYQVDKNKIALKSLASGKFVCAESSGAQPLIANRTQIGPWETFELVDKTGGQYALKSLANGKFVTASAQPLRASQSSAGLWETFIMPKASSVAQGPVTGGISCLPKASINAQFDDGWVKKTYGQTASVVNYNVVEVSLTGSYPDKDSVACHYKSKQGDINNVVYKFPCKNAKKTSGDSYSCSN